MLARPLVLGRHPKPFPIADLPALAPERGSSTLSGRSGQRRNRVSGNACGFENGAALIKTAEHNSLMG
jgi:hypothetical protein